MQKESMTPAQQIAIAKDFIRNPYAFPGGYARGLVMGNCDVICDDCARSNYRTIVADCLDGFDLWAPVAAPIIEEGCQRCDNCGVIIGSPELTTEIGPAHWLCYFINGDAGDMTDSEIQAANDFAKDCDGEIIDAMGEPFFGQWSGNWGDPSTRAGDLIEYVVNPQAGG